MTCNGEHNKKKYWITVIIVFLIVVIAVTAIVGDIAFSKKRERKYSKSIETVEEKKFMARVQKYIDVQNNFTDYIKRSRKIRLFAQSDTCAKIGRSILRKNGSAVDAGIAMIFCQGVVEPYNSGLGGGFLMLIYIHEDKKIITLDARETVPIFIPENMLKTSNRKGWLSAATPGEGLGLWEAHKKFGILPWKTLLQPSIRLATEGFPFSTTMRKFLDIEKCKMSSNNSLLGIFLNPLTNDFYKEGENYVNLRLSALLQDISNDGMNLLYLGEVADEIHEESLTFQGIIRKKDFENYRVKWSNTITSILEDGKNATFTVHVPPLPSYAMMIPMFLNIVQWYHHEKNFYPEVASTEAELLHHQVVEAMKHTFAQKARLDNKNSISVYEFYNFLSKHWALQMREKLNLTGTVYPDYLIWNKIIPGLVFDNKEEQKKCRLISTNVYGSTNVAAIASNGDAIVACCSLNNAFGSGVLTHGFVLNNNMDNYFNQVKDVQFDGNISKLLYNNRSTTFHSPMMVLDDEDEIKLVLSAYGDSRVISSMSLILMNHILKNDTLKEAVEKFRYHHEFSSGILIYEGPTIKYELENLVKYGHAVKMLNEATFKWPWILALAYEDEDPSTFGDPRRESGPYWENFTLMAQAYYNANSNATMET